MSNDLVILGRLGSPHGVRGWLKVNSFTNPTTNILEYPTWHIEHAGQWCLMSIVAARPQGNTLVVQLDGLTDRDQAALYTNDLIAVKRDELPATEDNEYYWNDLIGLTVTTTDDKTLGKIIELRETGANDVIVIEGERRHLIPFLKHVVLSVDLQNKQMRVDWDDDF